MPERVPARIPMTASQYLAHMGRIRGLAAATCARRSRELLDRFDLQPGPDAPVAVLSKGNRQKVMLAQAFLAPVDVLALDEPFAGLDPAAHGSLADLVDIARRDGAAVLVTGHRPDAFTGAPRILRIAGGRLHDEPAPTMSPTPATSEPGAMVVELVAGRDDAPGPERWVRVAGVRSCERIARTATLVIVVERAESDALLSAAIAAGWSVVRVVPADTPA